MIEDFLLVLIPVLLVAVIFALKQLIQRFLFAVVLLLGGSHRMALVLYSLIFVTGVLIHELSHFFMAALLGVRSGKITFFPDVWGATSGRVRMGSVQVEKTDFLRMSMVGAAPMIVGLLIITLLSVLFFDRIGIDAEHFDVFSLLRSARESFDWAQATLLYLIVSVSNTLFVSKEDTRSWPGVLIILAVAILIMVVGGVALPVMTSFVRLLAQRTSQVSYILLFVVMVDALIALLVGLTAGVAGKLLKRRVVYA